MLSPETLQRLYIGDRPMTHAEWKRVSWKRDSVYLQAAKELGMPAYCHNALIDRLDLEYPGWRGYSIPSDAVQIERMTATTTPPLRLNHCCGEGDYQ